MLNAIFVRLSVPKRIYNIHSYYGAIQSFYFCLEFVKLPARPVFGDLLLF